MNELNETNGWVQMTSRKYNAPYWYNPVTQQSVWIDPREEERKKTVSGAKDLTVNLKRSFDNREAEEAPMKRHLVEPNPMSRFILSEDFPLLAIEREKLRNMCADVLVNENSKYGEMKGSTKTATSCRLDGMKVGMQGNNLFAYIYNLE